MFEKKEMTRICKEQIEAGKYWLAGDSSREVLEDGGSKLAESSRLYWMLIIEASEAWLEHNNKKKRPLRKRPRLRRPEAD